MIFLIYLTIPLDVSEALLLLLQEGGRNIPYYIFVFMNDKNKLIMKI